MFHFDKTEQKPTSLKGSFIIKGVIHITGDNNEYEVIFEDFFYDGLEKDGYYLSQSDIDVYLKDELSNYDWGFESQIDACYNVYYKFRLNNSSYWTDCGYEYDSEIECIDLYILDISPEATDTYLKAVNIYQLEP